MTKCLLKALKAVDLQNHVELFRSLGYESAGALAHFHTEHFKQLHLSSQELVRFHALLDVLKEATREGKICPHYSKSHKTSSHKTTSNRAKSTESTLQRNSPLIPSKNPYSRNLSNETLKTKRISNSVGLSARTSTTSLNNRNHSDRFILQKPSSTHIQQYVDDDQQFSRSKPFINRSHIQHVKVNNVKFN